MDSLLSMEVFVAVVDKGSLTAAAEAFALSQPMVGKHIRHLEQRVGARLLVRTTRRQSLTEIGQLYYAQCRQILEQVRQAEAGTDALRLAPRGKLRINAPVSFGSVMLTPALTEFLTLYPEVQAELTLNDRVIDLVDEGYDVAVRVGTLADSGLVARVLRPYRMQICASPEYLARRGTPKAPTELLDHECLGFAHWPKSGGWLLDRDDQLVKSLPASRLLSNNGQALRVAALHGFGIVMQPSVLLAEDVAAGRLVPLLAEHLPAPMPMHLVYPRDRVPVPKLSRFIDFMLARFG
ncbi:LysR family transcriptional regulator [Rhodoferax koreense]|uniref:LysR family transcriptional regulator n=1 Tax=Rhodoferax koreensis TaxID=1842727 RepID=A0A1P8JZN0_9BURK|nr:LysR family transcriptional regulator [Rhodoferax koreense]APW39141.1 LysR family transcriptional regulator [Rhodoferax koreense]